MNPFGRTALDQLHRLGHRHRGRQRKQNVDVVLHTADFDGLHFVLACDAAQKWPQPVAQFRRDERATFLGAEDAMKIGTDVGYGIHSAVPSELMQSQFFPALKRRAIVGHPCGISSFYEDAAPDGAQIGSRGRSPDPILFPPPPAAAGDGWNPPASPTKGETSQCGRPDYRCGRSNSQCAVLLSQCADIIHHDSVQTTGARVQTASADVQTASAHVQIAGARVQTTSAGGKSAGVPLFLASADELLKSATIFRSVQSECLTVRMQSSPVRVFKQPVRTFR